MIDATIYNWKELARSYSIDAKDQDSFLDRFLDVPSEDIISRLDSLDGSYSIAIEKDGMTILARDRIGIRPVFYRVDGGLRYSFDKRDLDGIELDPREVIFYDGKIKIVKRDFFTIDPPITSPRSEIVRTLRDLLFDAIIKRMPDDGSPVGVLFSGGVDSTLLSYSVKMLKEKGRIRNDVICFTAGFGTYGQDTAKDLIESRKVADEYGLELHTNVVDLRKAERIIKEVVSIITDSNVVKVGVGATGAAAAALACGKVKVVFTGLGSEEIFAGYDRHRKADDVNTECLRGLEMIYERDCYRDFILCRQAGLELRLPYLDNALVDYALRIPARYKLEIQNKIILREVARSIGIRKDFSQRKKLGAQYGSKFDRAIEMLAKKSGFKYKSDYLDSLYEAKNI